MQYQTLRSTASVIVAIVLLAVVTAASFSGMGRPRAGDAPTQSAGGQAEHVIDVKDRVALAAFAENVFFGIVMSQSGSEGIPHREGGGFIPMTQFEVEVTATIKGNLAGTVIVNQYGGLDKEADEVVLFEGDPLMEPGEEYLFVTKLNTEFGWQSIVAPIYGNIRIDSDAMRAEVEAAFEAATGLEATPAGSDATRQPNRNRLASQPPTATVVTPADTRAPNEVTVVVSSDPSVPGDDPWR